MAERRRVWRAAQTFVDPGRLVFLDETGVATKMVRLHGWSPRGQACRDSAPFGRWRTMTFIAALRLEGLVAPWLIEGPMDGDAFLVYLRRVLLPELRRGDLLVLDNLATHKVAGVREILAERRVQAFYPSPYSPDINPIEMAFSKLKAILRQEPPRQSTPSNSASLPPSTASNLMNAQTSSKQQDTNTYYESALGGGESAKAQGVSCAGRLRPMRRRSV